MKMMKIVKMNVQMNILKMIQIMKVVMTHQMTVMNILKMKKTLNMKAQNPQMKDMIVIVIVMKMK